MKFVTRRAFFERDFADFTTSAIAALLERIGADKFVHDDSGSYSRSQHAEEHKERSGNRTRDNRVNDI